MATRNAMVPTTTPEGTCTNHRSSICSSLRASTEAMKTMAFSLANSDGW